MIPYSMKIVWTPEKLKVLKMLRDTGESFTDIARVLGVTSQAAKSAWHRKIIPTMNAKRLESNLILNADEKPNLPSLPMIQGLGESSKYRMVMNYRTLDAL